MKKMTKTLVSTTTRLPALPTPNYMKSTGSSDAKREQSKVSANNSSLHLHSTNPPNLWLNSTALPIASCRPRTTLLRKGSTHGNLQAGRATCSSTLRGSKVPHHYLKQNPAAVKVCRYSYCCCNGNLLPPFKCFVSARKPQTSTKQRCQSPKATPTGGGPNCAEIIGREEQPVSTIGAEDVPGLEGDYECTLKMENESVICADTIIPKSGGFFDEISVDEASQESLDEDTSFNSDALFVSNNWGNYLESLCSNTTLTPTLVPGAPEAAADAVKDDSSFGVSPPCGDTTVCCNNTMNGDEHNRRDKSLPDEDATTDIGNQPNCKAIEPDQDHAEYDCNQAESFSGMSLTDKLHTGDSGLNSNECECIAVHELSPENTTIPETEDTSSTQSTAKYNKSNQEYDDPRCFNPREVDLELLPLEPEPEAEKVTLRHQQLDARKNADEWMVDYALRQAVTKVGNSSQRKVASIVEAIEIVVPPSK